MKQLMLSIVIALAFGARAQDLPRDVRNQPSVTIAAKGSDVRAVLTDMFAQAKKDFVLEPNIRFVLYLSLTEMPFEEALEIVCRTASLKYEVQNGIWFITKKPAPKPVEAPPLAKPAEAKPSPPAGKLPSSVLKVVVTTRFSRGSIGDVMADLGRQAGIEIEIAPDVPDYRLDAFLIKTSLKYALDNLTRAAGLKWEFTERKSLRISRRAKG